MATPTEINLVNSASVTWAAGDPYPDPNNPQQTVRDVTATAIATPINWRGAWSSANSYAVGDAVSLSGSSYLCISPNTNQSPPNGTYWGVLSSASGVSIAGDLGGTEGSPEVVGIQGVGVSATAPTNGQVLQYDSGSGLYVPTTPSSGGGGLLGVVTPSSLTPPSISSLTWGNQNSATAAANAGGALYLAEAIAASNVPFLYKSAPSTPWTLIIGFISGGSGSVTTSNFAGLICRESSSGKLIAFFVGTNSGGTVGFELEKWTNYTTFSAAYLGPQAIYPPPICWLSLTDDGTNLTWKTAIDGQNFKQVYQSARGNWFSSHPDQVGIGINPQSASQVCDALFLHWSGV